MGNKSGKEKKKNKEEKSSGKANGTSVEDKQGANDEQGKEVTETTTVEVPKEEQGDKKAGEEGGGGGGDDKAACGERLENNEGGDKSVSDTKTDSSEKGADVGQSQSSEPPSTDQGDKSKEESAAADADKGETKTEAAKEEKEADSSAAPAAPVSSPAEEVKTEAAEVQKEVSEQLQSEPAVEKEKDSPQESAPQGDITPSEPEPTPEAEVAADKEVPKDDEQVQQEDKTEEGEDDVPPPVPSSPPPDDSELQAQPKEEVTETAAEDSTPAKAEDSPKTEDVKVATTFEWDAEAENVKVTGSFNDWKEQIALEKNDATFKTTVDLPEGEYLYKYIVDDQWVINEKQPTKAGDDGIQNNVVVVKAA